MIPACIFTYSGAALRLPWAVRGALLAGLVPVVCQDIADPLPPHVLGWLAGEGVEVRTTAFPRRGNLNGTDCAAGICRELARACNRHGSTHAIKLDDDTLIVRRQVFTQHLPSGAVGLTWTAGRPGAYGLAYCLSRETAEAAAKHLEASELTTDAPEDLTVWHAAKQFGTWAEVPFQLTGGGWSAFPLGADPDEAVQRFDVLTVGNRPEGGWKDRPRQMAAMMKILVTAAADLQRACNAVAD
jgi:hypothetical protein